MYDTIIIGAGPAGITAGIYAKRGNLETLIIHNGESALQRTKNIENYYGFIGGISGDKLYFNGIKQAENLGIDVKNEEVIKIEFKDNGYNIVTNIKTYSTKSVILATGIKKNVPKIKGIKEFEGKGISYCAICDGFFYKNKTVAVVGSGNYAVSEANDLINIVSKLIILTNGAEKPEIRGENIEINSKQIKEFEGNGKIEKIEFNDGTNLPIDGVFIAQGTADSSDFARKLGIMLNDNKIKVDENMETNISGIFACGDCIGGTLQISKAVNDGMIAGLSVIQYVKKIIDKEEI